MNTTEQVDQMNRAQYADDLDHKMEVYDGVKATIKLCQIMIDAIEPTTTAETQARTNLLSYLWTTKQYALMAASDVQIEKGKLPK